MYICMCAKWWRVVKILNGVLKIVPIYATTQLQLLQLEFHFVSVRNPTQTNLRTLLRSGMAAYPWVCRHFTKPRAKSRQVNYWLQTQSLIWILNPTVLQGCWLGSQPFTHWLWAMSLLRVSSALLLAAGNERQSMRLAEQSLLTVPCLQNMCSHRQVKPVDCRSKPVIPANPTGSNRDVPRVLCFSWGDHGVQYILCVPLQSPSFLLYWFLLV